MDDFPVRAELPWDGTATGKLMVRGHWIVERYLGADSSPLVDGWFPTGDVATIDRDGFMRITERAKDVIKSGGGWISSIELENIATEHPAVALAACIDKPRSSPVVRRQVHMVPLGITSSANQPPRCNAACSTIASMICGHIEIGNA